jgi:2-methylcitrate dehydratase PrpD
MNRLAGIAWPSVLSRQRGPPARRPTTGDKPMASAQPTASLSSIVADFVHASTYADLPNEVTRITRQHLLDTLGCCLAATKVDTSRLLRTYLLSEGGAEQATAIGIRGRLPAPQAAFINGLLARTHEFDDMAMPDLHPSGVVVPVALAVSEHRGISGANLLAAIALGLELCLRIGWAGYDGVARTSRFLQRGQDASAICGTLAGAAVAAKLMGLDAKRIADAIGIAVSFAGGSLEANRSGGTIKRFQSGWAAKSAIQAATLASCGVDGPAQAFDGRYGFYRCFIDGDFDAAVLTRGLGTEWRMTSLRFKPYPSNYYTHPGIDAALALRRKGLRAEDVQSAHLAVATPMLHTIGEPLDRKQAPHTAYEAKFSGPYTVASALIGGTGLGLGIDDFTDELVAEPMRRALMSKISVGSDPSCDAIFPDQAPAILTVAKRNGEQVVEQTLVNRASPESPLSEDEVAIKFADTARRALSPELADRLRTHVGEIAAADDIAPIAAILGSAAT